MNWTADSCSEDDVQYCVDNCISDGDTVLIPAGACDWGDEVAVTGNITFEGAGSSSTLLTLSGSNDWFFDHQQVDTFAEYSGIGFYAPDGRGQGTSQGIYFRDTANYRVHDCYFEGCWHGVIAHKRVVKGLIDHNTFKRTDDYTSDYGIELGSNYDDSKPDECTYSEQSCRDAWDVFWDDPDTNYGMVFNEDFPAGSVGMIYVEANYFDWKGSACEGNWGSKMAICFRYNTIVNRDGNTGGVKPGAQWVEFYNNKVTNTAEGAEADPAGAAFYMRASGLVHHNEFVNYNSGGQFAAWYCGFGYCYTDQALMDEAYVFSNVYTNCDCPGDNSDCWTEWGEGAPERIAEDQNYFFRAPESGDRIYPYTMYTCPHPLTGLSGSCDEDMAGLTGYPTESGAGGGTTTTGGTGTITTNGTGTITFGGGS